MRIRTFVVLGAVVTGLMGAPPPAHALKSLWTDPAGDADVAQGTGQSIPAGFDLTDGIIRRKGKNLEFGVVHADMPPSGTLPEGFRFLWAFSVGKNNYRITAKSADIGKPDLVAGETTERVGRADVLGHFRLEGDCAAGAQVGVLAPTNCKPLAYVDGVFSGPAKSFIVSVPMKLIKAKPGSKILPGGGEAIGICGICWVTHTEERSLQATIVDAASVAKAYKIPK